MKSYESTYRVKSISELHSIIGFEKPKHPLITIIDYSKVNVSRAPDFARFCCDFYSVNFKSHCSLRYGRHFFDHQGGTLLCTAPEQIITMENTEKTNVVEGWGLFFHPEFIRNPSLGSKISAYTFFRYEENEALHLSSDEKEILIAILRQMEKEYQTNIDNHSQILLLTNLELLLNYCMRFYGRQFITRTNQNKDVIAKFERLILEYLQSGKSQNLGLLSVKYCAENLNLSANYFSDLLKSETGKNAIEHIHYHLLDRAKNLLTGSDKTINEIALALGFEYPQNFSKLFKKKLGVSPSEYRNKISKN